MGQPMTANETNYRFNHRSELGIALSLEKWQDILDNEVVELEEPDGEPGR